MFSLLSRVILFIIYLFTSERRDFPSCHLRLISKEMMGEEVFQMHVATPTYATRPMSLYKIKQETSSTGSSFPTSAQQFFFPRVFFPCRCKFRLQICNGNQTTRPLATKHMNWVDNYQMIIMHNIVNLHHFTCYGENAIRAFSPL